jgi:uncharacterized protein YbaA (DUF1428 family)
MNYMDGFVAAVPRPIGKSTGSMRQRLPWYSPEYGALNVVECWGDNVPEGKLTS